MKRIIRAISLLLAAALTAAVLCGCTATNRKKDSGKLNIIATIFPPYDFARQIGGEYADVTMLLRPGMESHSYDPTPQDIIKIRECDIFIYCGGESDEWVRDILDSADKKPKKIIAMMDCVDTVEEKTVEGMTAEDEHDEGDSIEYDEHVWTSPVNALKISKKISEAMQELDPGHSEEYKNKENTYAKELSALDDTFRKITENAERKTLIFGDRFPFRYFADEYGLSYYAAFPGCSSETEPSAATVSFLIEKVREKKIPVVFSIEFSNGKVADTICESTGAKRMTFHSCHNVTQEQLDAGETYISLMRVNSENLKEALS